MNAITKEVAYAIAQVKEKNPLVHAITNYVTVNDCANAILAIGASPIMADDCLETTAITAISSALVLNIGTLNTRVVSSMLESGKKASKLGIPVIFDPVGAGASAFRNETTQEIVSRIPLTILRGNLSEISYIAGHQASVKGVDSVLAEDSLDTTAIARQVADLLHCTVAITGAVDVISDGKRVVKIRNGHPMLSRVTGTGCMTSALVGAFAGACSDPFIAAVSGVAAMGIAGDIAYEKSGAIGTGSFHISILDALSNLSAAVIIERAKIDEL